MRASRIQALTCADYDQRNALLVLEFYQLVGDIATVFSCTTAMRITHGIDELWAASSEKGKQIA